MADIEDTGFGINGITVEDHSIGTVSSPAASINILPSLHPVFSSDGIDNKIVERSDYNDVLKEFGSDFEDINLYGQQNLNVKQVLSAGGTAFLCRLLPDNAKIASAVVRVGIKASEAIPVYKRDGFGEFVLDENGNKIPLTRTLEVNDGTGQAPLLEPVSVPGVEFKIVVETPSDDLWEKYPTVRKMLTHYDRVVENEDDGFVYYPLMFVSYYARGKCGLNYGFKITNDFARDDKVNDGRRYQLYLVHKTGAGSETLGIGNGLAFSFNPEAQVSSTVATLEGLQKVYSNIGDNSDAKQMQINYYQSSFKNIQKAIENILGAEIPEDLEELNLKTATSVLDVDFINAMDKDGLSYDNIIMNEESADLTKVNYLKGGTDGDFDTLTGDELEACKISLLKKFFTGDIESTRADLFDVLRCDAAIVYDANYPMEVKSAIIELKKYRRDICAIFDCGETDNILDAIAVADEIRGRITTCGENYAITPHFGTTTNRTIDARVSATYEMAYGLTSLYKRSPFSLYAGKPNDNGCVKTMLFDWVVEETKPKGYYEKLAKNARLYYAIDMGKSVSSLAIGNTTKKNVYFFSNANLYTEKVSKLSEFRNGLLTNDIRRVLKLTLPRYTFDTDGAEVAIANAKEALTKIFNNRYPSNVIINLSMFQTERDALLNQATCQVELVFPDIFETWNCTIIVERNGTTEV